MNILKKLLFAETLKYSELKLNEIENSLFVFHLNKLVKNNFVEKNKNKYSLTSSGKEFANRMSTDKSLMKSFPKTTTILCCTRENKDGIKEYLIYKRLKNPFYGSYGFPTQKIFFGEKINEGAEAGLKQETNLVGTPELIGIRHYHVRNKDSEILEDKVMYSFYFKNPKGELSGSIEGEYLWVKENLILKIAKPPLPEFQETYEMLRKFNGQISFKEVNQTVLNF